MSTTITFPTKLDVRSLSAEELVELKRIEAGIITEDGMPVHNIYHEMQMRLLTSSLNANWRGPSGDGRFITKANVGIFHMMKNPAVVPDVFLSVDVEIPIDEDTGLPIRSYFIWRFGKAPDVVIEIVSDRRGEELGEKLNLYARMGVPYYVVFDPSLILGTDRLYVFHRPGSGYQPMTKNWFPTLNLGVTLWHGTFENLDTVWLRWCTEDDTLIPTAEEILASAEKAATEAQVKIDALRELLRQHGIDPPT